jgi:hypothetical protein
MLLAKLGLTPQKPLQRADQRDPQAIAAWQTTTYPQIAKAAKAHGAEIYFWDESGFRADEVRGRTWGVRADAGGGGARAAPVGVGGFGRHRAIQLVHLILEKRQRGQVASAPLIRQSRDPAMGPAAAS